MRLSLTLINIHEVLSPGLHLQNMQAFTCTLIVFNSMTAFSTLSTLTSAALTSRLPDEADDE